MDLDPPARRRFAHGTGPGFNARERCNTTGGLDLPVPLADRETGPFLPYPDYLGIERFAGTGAVAQGREVELLQIGKDQHPVNGRGTAEGADLVLFKKRQDFGCLKFPDEVIDKDTCTFDPLAEDLTSCALLAEDLTPCALYPAGIGDREMEIVVPDILPEPGVDDMTQRITVVVEHHLRLAGSAGCEIDQHRVRTPHT